jgi:chromosome segregation ATPase
MNTNRSIPSWLNKEKKWMPSKNTMSEEERLENVRNQYAEIIMDVFPRKINYQEMIDSIDENMVYINDFIEKDNIRLRDAYLNDQITRTEKFLKDVIDYKKIINDKYTKIESNKLNIQEIMLKIQELSKKLEEIKKNKPYTIRGKTPILTKEEVEINSKIDKLPNEKNKLEEENEELEKYIEGLIEDQKDQDNLIIEKKKYIEYLHANWNRYYHNGVMIILPNN